jgi:hypothetical protein
MIVMRVFPGDVIAAPRFPLLKSYSLRMILLRFASTGFTCRHETSSIATRRMHHDQNASKRIHAQGHKPALTFGVKVLDRDCQWIAEYLLGVREANSVLGQI